jgi:hypothetical protein
MGSDDLTSMRDPIRVDILNPEERTKVERWYLRVVGIHAVLALVVVALSAIPADVTWAPAAKATSVACVPPGFEFHNDTTSSASASNYCVASTRSSEAAGVVGP